MSEQPPKAFVTGTRVVILSNDRRGEFGYVRSARSVESAFNRQESWRYLIADTYRLDIGWWVEVEHHDLREIPREG